MNRSFIAPIAIASAAHAALFFAPGNPPIPVRETPPTKVVEVDISDPIPIDKPEVEPSDEEAVVNDATPPPQRPDFPDANVTPESFTQPIAPPPLNSGAGISTTIIAADWPTHKGPATTPSLIGVGDLDNTPSARFQPAPIYPADLKKLAIHGRATVTFSVDTSGRTFNPTVVSASDPQFADEALKAVRKWRFEPGTKNGKRVAFRMAQTFQFALNS